MSKLLAAITAVTVFAVIAYFYFSGKEFVIRVPESKIQEKLQEKLPLTKTYLFVVQVTLDNPRVQLVNGTKRVSAGLDVIFNITLNKNPKPMGGTVDVSGGILYSAENGQFFLKNPVIEKLEVQGIPQIYTDKVNKALTKALADYYEKHPIYTLSATDAKQAAARMVLKNVIIENQELVVILGI